MPDSVISGNNLSKDKAEHFWETLKQLGVYCRKHWWSIFLSVFFSVVGTMLMVIAPEKLKDRTNLISAGLRSGIDIKEIGKLSFLVAFLYLFSFIFNLIIIFKKVHYFISP